MRFIEIDNQSKPLSKPLLVKYCDSFTCRLLGLMFRKTVEKGSGLLLVQGTDSRIDSSIHMFFVFTDLAVFWIDSKMKVVDKVLAKSWKPLYIPRAPARYVLECHPEEFPSLSIGDLVRFGD